jgi:hypothetical protein
LANVGFRKVTKEEKNRGPSGDFVAPGKMPMQAVYVQLLNKTHSDHVS